MCGIAGIFSTDPEAVVAPDDLERMTAVLEHRGPDEGAVFADGCAGLGHRRLKIIDLESGRQPILNEDGTAAIVFNGEIYNFQPLREELAGKGHRFTTRTDTEVILHAFEEYREACVDRLRGMFAFAIWDGKRRELFLARDRVGIKPLYYAWDGRTLVFASELKAILEHPAVRRDIDPCAIDEYLSYLYIPAPRTIFRNVFKLLPGHTLTVSSDRFDERQYWDLSFETEEGAREERWMERIREALRESISVHLVSDVPLGAFLSGGVDSSCVVAMMSQMLDHPVQTATIGFREAGFDEAPHARRIAELFGADAYEKTVEARAADILDTLIWHYDEPFADSSMVPTYHVSQVARERVTVCLSGDGGDENFAGYRRYRFDAAENRVRAILPAFLRRPLFGAAGALYPKADWLPRVLRAKTTLMNLARSPERGYFHSLTCFHEDLKRSLYLAGFRRELAGHDAFSVFERYFERTRGWDPLSRIQYVDIKTYLVDDILTKVDRASMAHSLEVRVPVLDHEVMELAARVPPGLKLRRGEGKYIFKRALEGILPDEILYRPKQGFCMPIGAWFRGELRERFEDTVLAPGAFIASYLDQAVLGRMWREHQRGLRDYSAHLWALLVLEAWGQRFASAGAAHALAAGGAGRPEKAREGETQGRVI